MPGAALREPVARETPHDRLAAMLAPKLAEVQRIIDARMASDAAPRIPEVTAHLVNAGGKRLRPMLCLAAAAMTGDAQGNDAKLGATVEFIHTATLLHDDVVDDARQRRGRPTANLLWDNTSSVLVGDYLFARAFQLMVECGSLRVLDILSDAAATIAEGEVLQLTAQRNLAVDEDTYIRIARGKTAALFAAACEAGALVAGADDDAVETFRRYGDALGIAFQIADDLLDYAGDSAATGKAVGGDLSEGKMTLPVIKSVATGEDRAFWERVVTRGDLRAGDLETALAIFERHGALEATRRQALDWSGRAAAALAPLPGGPLRDALLDLADYVVARIS